MITSLSISNYALIEKLSIEFSSGFTTITGETGAGKSILLGALGLALGDRADLTSLRNKGQKCVIEAQFSLAEYDLKLFFDANDLDYEALTIIRREILPSGKSRAFINDTPVNLQQLQELGSFLIDIHSQHETRELTENAYQFTILDAIAGNQIAVLSYAGALQSYKHDKLRLEQMKLDLAAAIREQDYNEFLLDELNSAGLEQTDQAELESTVAQLGNVETIRENIGRALSALDGEEFGAILQIKEARAAMQKLASVAEPYSTLAARVESAIIELDDIVSELQSLSDNLTNDPAKLTYATQRLEQIYALQKKHQVDSVGGLLEIQKVLGAKSEAVLTLENDIIMLETGILNHERELDVMASEISERRRQTIPGLTKKWALLLSQLGMPDARFSIDLAFTDKYLANGKDDLTLLFAANKGSNPGLLRKVASGGEMSRIMLATKAILAEYSKLPTIIFDEIDTGVSGEIADKMGLIMKKMSATMQVFAITHLPQIASKGNTHFKVFKSDSGNVTSTEIRKLDAQDRITEIAQMLSGETVSESAINHARALLT